MSGHPILILDIEFYAGHIETIVRHHPEGQGYVHPELISSFLRQLADQIDNPAATTIAKYLTKKADPE